MPLIYNGQEAGNSKRLEFFEKDPIVWKQDKIGELYKNLFALMHKNSALWHAKWGPTMIKVPNNSESEVFSFVRQNEKDKVFAVFNFSNKAQTVQFEETLFPGNYTDFSTNETMNFTEDTQLQLKPWEYRIYVK